MELNMQTPAQLLQDAANSIVKLISEDTIQRYKLSGTYAENDLASPPSEGEITTHLYQSQVADAFIKSRGNEIVFLPTGLDIYSVLDKVIADNLQRHPSKHVVIVVTRPAHALSFSHRLQRRLGIKSGAYCGGDYLYDFPKEFEANKVLVFTAGLLMHLTRQGTYSLQRSSILVLHDTFSAIRNHPMNTLVREYYWKGTEPNEGGGKEEVSPAHTEAASASKYKPRIIGVVLPQIHNLQRPFDKLRQLIRKICASAQAGILLPTGIALEELAGRLHKSHFALHGYDLLPLERSLLESIQAHCLLVWDTLHPFHQNHFGRLIHFPPAPQPASGAPSGAGSGAAHTGREMSSMQHQQRNKMEKGSPSATATTSMNASNTFALDPFHHDWYQIELMVRSSIAASESLPEEEEGHLPILETKSTPTATTKENGMESKQTPGSHPHIKSSAALAVMHHVLQCCLALRRGMELGIAPCLSMVLPSLQQLQRYVVDRARNAPHASSTSINEQLVEKIRSVLPSSPLLEWIAQRGDDPAALLSGASEGNSDVSGVNDRDNSTGSCSDAVSSDGRVNLSRSGSRMNALLDVLHSIKAHATYSFLLGQSGRNAQDRHRIAIIAADDASAETLVEELSLRPHREGLHAEISRWKRGEEIEVAASVNKKTDKTDNRVAVDEMASAPVSFHLVIMTVAEAGTSYGACSVFSSYQEVVWFSAADVMFAAGFDFESPALNLLSGICAVGGDTGPECHVIATQTQAAAWMEIRRADQMMLAVMQLVQAGSASLEQYFAHLANRRSGMADGMHGEGKEEENSFLVPSPASLLHMICLGLCGEAPKFVKSSAAQSVNGTAHDQSEASLPQRHNGHGQQQRYDVPHHHSSSSAATVVFTAALPQHMILPVPGHQFELLRSFYRGNPCDSEAEARDSAAENALMALLSSGFVAAYWQTRQLLVDSQRSALATRFNALHHGDRPTAANERSISAAAPVFHPSSRAPVAGSGVDPGGRGYDAYAMDDSYAHRNSRHHNNGKQTPVGSINKRALPPSPFDDGTMDAGLHAGGVSSDRFICNTCGIVTTSQAHLNEHMQGRRHLQNLERLKQELVVESNARAAAEAVRSSKTETTATAAAAAAAAVTSPRADGLMSTLTSSSSEGFLLHTRSTIDRLPSTLSDAFLRRSSSSLHRNPSGNVYEGFPCVRVGDMVLPSSMDLRAFLDDMQTLELEGAATGLLNEVAGAHLATVDEVELMTDNDTASIGSQGGTGTGGDGKNVGPTMSTDHHQQQQQRYAQQQTSPARGVRGSRGTGQYSFYNAHHHAAYVRSNSGSSNGSNGRGRTGVYMPSPSSFSRHHVHHNHNQQQQHAQGPTRTPRQYAPRHGSSVGDPSSANQQTTARHAAWEQQQQQQHQLHYSSNYTPGYQQQQRQYVSSHMPSSSTRDHHSQGQAPGSHQQQWAAAASPTAALSIPGYQYPGMQYMQVMQPMHGGPIVQPMFLSPSPTTGILVGSPHHSGQLQQQLHHQGIVASSPPQQQQQHLRAGGYVILPSAYGHQVWMQQPPPSSPQ